MTREQKQILFILCLIGLLYFAALFFPNAAGAEDEPMRGRLSQDEAMTYPIVTHILTPTENLRSLPSRLILYGDYHYGYPFYFFSALVLLPMRILYGEGFLTHTQLSMLLLRQFISVLPMILAAGILVYLQTRFKSLFKSVLLFVFLLSIRAVFRNNLAWWHPDALAVLAVVLTLFFLDRDRLRFGRNYYLAAVACGLATAIKLQGVFFFVTILAYLLYGLARGHLPWRKAALVSLAFVVVMSATVVASNPFLFFQSARERMVKIQTFKAYELEHGYTHDDPINYQKGPQWWEWTLRKWYAHPLFLGFLLVSLLAGCLWGPNRFLSWLILSWVVPYSLYLLYRVAPKPDHYWLAVMLPLFSSGFNLPAILRESMLGASQEIFPRGINLRSVSLGIVLLILAAQLFINVADPFSGTYARYVATLYQESTLR